MENQSSLLMRVAWSREKGRISASHDRHAAQQGHHRVNIGSSVGTVTVRGSNAGRGKKLFYQKVQTGSAPLPPNQASNGYLGVPSRG